MYAFLSLTLLVLNPCGSLEPGTASAQELEARVREASRAARTGLHSGTGKGSYLLQSKDSEHGSWTTDTRATLETRLSEGRYLIKLSYELDRQSEQTKRIILNDGSGVFSSFFGNSYRPLGCRVEVFEASKRLPGSVSFPWNPTDLLEPVLDLVRLEEPQARRMQVQRDSTGLLRGHWEADELHCEFEADPASGYNLRRVKLQNQGDNLSFYEYQLTWQQVQGVWVVCRLAEHFRLPGGAEQRTQLSYDEFQANVPVGPESFTLAALEVPAGTPIAVLKKGVDPEYLVLAEPRNTAASDLDSLLEQLRQQPLKTSSPSSGSRFVPLLLLLSTALLLIASLLYYLRLRRNRS
jgi:hypothetical protein